MKAMSLSRRTKLALLVVLAATALQAEWALASQPSFAPWQNIDLYAGTAIRGGRMLPLQATGPEWQGQPKNGAVLLFGADMGGVLRSIDLGHTWVQAKRNFEPPSSRYWRPHTC